MGHVRYAFPHKLNSSRSLLSWARRKMRRQGASCPALCEYLEGILGSVQQEPTWGQCRVGVVWGQASMGVVTLRKLAQLSTAQEVLGLF